MTKTQLDGLINRKFYWRTGQKVTGVSDVIIEHFTETLERRKRIEIRGFGAWFVRHTSFKRYLNPKTGIFFIKEGCYKFRFKCSPVLNNSVNEVNKDREDKKESPGVLPTVPEPMVDTDEAIDKAIDKIKEDK